MQWFKEAIGSRFGSMSWCNKLKVDSWKWKVVLVIFICKIWLLGVFDRKWQIVLIKWISLNSIPPSSGYASFSPQGRSGEMRQIYTINSFSLWGEKLSEGLMRVMWINFIFNFVFVVLNENSPTQSTGFFMNLLYNVGAEIYLCIINRLYHFLEHQ